MGALPFFKCGEERDSCAPAAVLPEKFVSKRPTKQQPSSQPLVTPCPYVSPQALAVVVQPEAISVDEHADYGVPDAALEQIGKRDERWVLGLHHVEYFVLEPVIKKQTVPGILLDP